MFLTTIFRSIYFVFIDVNYKYISTFALLVSYARVMGNICSSINLTLCMLSDFACFFIVCRFLKKWLFLKTSFGNTNRESDSLDPDQARLFVGPDLGPNFLQSLSADGKLLQARKMVGIPYIKPLKLYNSICYNRFISRMETV